MTTCPLCGHENPDSVSVCPACGHGASVPEPEPRSFFARLPRHTRQFLVVFYGLATLDSLALLFGWINADVFLSLAAGLTVAWWVITDASDRGRPMSCAVRLLVILFSILFSSLAALIYLIVSRRLRGFGWFLLNLTMSVVVVVTPSIIKEIVLAETSPYRSESPDLPPVTPELPPLPTE